MFLYTYNWAQIELCTLSISSLSISSSCLDIFLDVPVPPWRQLTKGAGRSRRVRLAWQAMTMMGRRHSVQAQCTSAHDHGIIEVKALRRLYQTQNLAFRLLLSPSLRSSVHSQQINSLDHQRRLFQRKFKGYMNTTSRQQLYFSHVKYWRQNHQSSSRSTRSKLIGSRREFSC